MFANLAKKIFGSSNDRLLKTLQGDVEAINALEESLVKLSDSELRAKTDEFKARIEKGETVEDILVEAFAVVREAAKRTLGQRHFDVQLLGGMVLHKGMIAEMKTGEGKTLVATLPVYLNALPGKGVHVVTVNDYLAQRDSAWMGQIYNFLGLSVGCIVHGLTDMERKTAYGADITYGTNNEFGFDYLRDNMKFSINEMVQRPFHYAIVDEVDSILIDEARTPLIISGPVEDNSELYIKINQFIPKLAEEDYELDEKTKNISLTEAGNTHLEEMLKSAGIISAEGSLYDLANIAIIHHANQALKAHKVFQLDRDYIVNNHRIVIIDEFTGRMMEGRRYSEGLHQALEAKENVPIQNENQTLASITFQNYFRMYPKLAGMTGTADTEAAEFQDIYKLEVVSIPTNVPVARVDDDDAIYRTMDEKYQAMLKLIDDCVKRNQPVLVGTVSIEKSEYLAGLLKKQKIAHQVLNARYHEKEAEIISQAGKPGAVTIATNMAGRGTDIKLGGNVEMLTKAKLSGIEDEKEKKKIIERIEAEVARDKEIVLKAGGLCVIGTERHESRRIDNQLRGRSGRQGDPGHSRFFLSLEDDLIRIFGADKRMDFVMRTLGESGEPITHPMLSRTLEKAQQKVEARNYEIRKNLLKFDDVMNDQRKVIFEQRIDLMNAEHVNDTLTSMWHQVVEDLLALHMPVGSYAEQWDLATLEAELKRIFNLDIPVQQWGKEEGVANTELYERIVAQIAPVYAEKEAKYGAKLLRNVEKQLLLYTLDELWKGHLLSLDQLRQGINLRAYGQKDPLNEYKREAFEIFENMLNHLREVVSMRYSHLEITTESEAEAPRKKQRMKESRVDPASSEKDEITVQGTISNKPAGPIDPSDPSTWGKVGRNDACPCGSGKKYKHCHGKLA